MADHTNDPRYQRLLTFFEQHPDAVLTPHILKHWERISALAEDACRVSLSGALDAAEAFRHSTDKAAPLLPDVLRYVLAEPPQLDKWEQSERYLQQQGFTSNALEFFTCGGEALVFTINGCPDLLLKVSQEYKLPNLVPFMNKAVSKAVFPMSRWENQDRLHALQEFDASNAERLSDNRRFCGSSEQIALALSARLGAHYTDIRKVGDAAGITYRSANWSDSENPPGWSRELEQAIRARLAQNPELEARMKKISIRGAKGLERQVNACIPFDDDPLKEYALNDQKYNNFMSFTGFATMPFAIDRRSVAVEKIYNPKYHSRQASDAETAETYKTYYDFLALVRSVYHEKYGMCDKTFSTVAEIARTASKEAWRSHLAPDKGISGTQRMPS